MALATTLKTIFAIYAKIDSRRATELPSVPTNLMIAVILNPLLRGLRPSEAEIAKMTGRKWAWPRGTFSRNLKFRLLSFFDYTYKKRLTCKFIDFYKKFADIEPLAYLTDQTKGVASRVSQNSRISSEKSKKYFFLRSSQNHLKRIENHF